MPSFYILDTLALPSGYNHRFFEEKLARGFGYDGFEVKVATSIKDLTEPGFVLIRDHRAYYSLGSRGNRKGNALRMIPAAMDRYDRFKLFRKASDALQRRELKALSVRMKGKGQVLISWNGMTNLKLYDGIDLPVIFSSEYYYSRPVDDFQIRTYDFYAAHENSLPMALGADVDPDKVGEGCGNSKYLVSYVGDKTYRQDCYGMYQNRADCRVVPTPPYISEEEKDQICRDSKISLGLNGQGIIRNKIANSRVFEAIASGAICLTNNPSALPATDNCSVLFETKEQLKDLVDDFNSNEEKRLKLRQKGFEFIKKEGTLAYRAKSFIKLANKLYGTNF